MRTPKNIFRVDVDHRNTHGWQVRVTRQDFRHTRFFSDGRYGSPDGARTAAEGYRDQLLAELPEPRSGAEAAAQVRTTSGVPGIRLSFSDGVPRLVADTRLPDGRRKVRSFSLRKWGLRTALWKACGWKAETALGGSADPRHIQTMYETAYQRVSKQLGADQGDGVSTAAAGVILPPHRKP